ncbi:MAG: hypothetical protein M3R24_32235 [Chloroflexota bacterium]|nr:hypothetical protein [Chloroflexota bacterium]
MNYLDKYIPDHYSLQGLRSLLSPCFASNDIAPNIVLNGLRQFLEQLLYHLSAISGVDEKGVSTKIDKLENAGVIDRQVTPYFHMWWKVSCLGSHFQKSDVSKVISWEEHLDFCRQAAGVCISWYINKYPPLTLTLSERKKWLEDASTVVTVPFTQIQVCHKEDIEKHINSMPTLVLHGEPWAGKTSIASYWVTELCLKGYIPIVIHENSLVTFRILSSQNDVENPKNLKLATNAQVIHEIVSTRLLHGDSFVIFLDDPFGHRKYQQHNPLMFLRIEEWCKIASYPQTLGDIKVIITSPSTFLEQGYKTLAQNAVTNPISRANLALLKQEYQVQIDVDMYNKDQLLNIVTYSASHHNCSWSGKLEYAEIVADTLIDNRLSFDALHVLCRNYEALSDDQFLEGIYKISRSLDIEEEIRSLSNSSKVRLCAAYVGEALIELYREFMFQSKVSFEDLYLASEQETVLQLEEINSLNDWLLEDRVATMNLSYFPVFSHPEVRFVVGKLAETEMRPIVRNIVANVCGLSEEYEGTTLARWEAIHLLCRMAPFIAPDQVQIIHDTHFFRSDINGGDPRNILWAILGSWHYIENSTLDRSARGFLKSLPYNFKSYIRAFIWEATENWTYLNQEIRYLLITFSGRGGSLHDIEANFDTHNTIAFLAAGVSHYGIIQDCARAGCPVSEKYIEFISSLIVQISKSSKKNMFTSRTGDGLFDAPGSQYGSEDVLKGLKNLGLRRGTLDNVHPLVKQINDLLG